MLLALARTLVQKCSPIFYTLILCHCIICNHYIIYCGVQTRCWAGTLKQITGRWPLLCNGEVNMPLQQQSYCSVNPFPRQRGETVCCLHGPRRGVVERREMGQPVSWALQGRLRRNGVIVELTVDRSSAWADASRRPEWVNLKNLHC
jgi:hypothetical protein